jgi:hypothetical protein
MFRAFAFMFGAFLPSNFSFLTWANPKRIQRKGWKEQSFHLSVVLCSFALKKFLVQIPPNPRTIFTSLASC